MDKKKLQDALLGISTPEEATQLTANMIQENLVTSIKSINDTLELNIKELSRLLVSARSESAMEVIGGLGEVVDKLGSKLDEVKGTISTSFEKNKPVDSAPVFKDMINSISEVNQSIKDKPVPNWNWPQYAGVSVRDRNFRNINPATDGLDIGDFDYVARVLTNATTETYTFKTGGASGTTVATVVIVYTAATLATISTVTKTPVTVQ